MPKIKLKGVKDEPEIEVPSAERALIYIDHLEDAAKQLIELAAVDKKLSGVQDVELLASLAVILDLYVLPSVVAEINDDIDIYEGTPADFYQSVAKQSPEWFAKKHPFAAGMLKVVSWNFVHNLTTACERILGDWNAIAAFFFPKREILRLAKIKSSGSDFHRGGQQVLFLTFEAVALAKKGSKTVEVSKHLLGALDSHETELLKLVYKPADLERDCKTVGDWDYMHEVGDSVPKGEAKNDLVRVFNSALKTGSLVNLLNRLCKLKLPCYRILPRNPGSFIQNSEIGTSYGYLEYLEPLCKPADDLALYFRQLGALTAAAYVFGYTDIHHDNVILRPSGPHLIDLEMAFLGVMSVWAETSISVGESDVREDHYDIDLSGPKAKIKISFTYRPAVSAMDKDTVTHADIIGKLFSGKKSSPLAVGFQETLKIIASKHDLFAGWLASMEKTVARLIPETTEFLLNTLRSLHDASLRPGIMKKVVLRESEKDLVFCCTQGDWSATNVKNAGAVRQLALWQERIGKICGGYKKRLKELDNFSVKKTFSTDATLTAKEKPLILLLTSVRDAAPWFCVWATGAIAEDFLRGDIPSYYARFNSQDVLDSSGNVVDVGPLAQCGNELGMLEKLFEWKWGGAFLPLSLYETASIHLENFAKSEAYRQYFAANGPK